MLTLSLQKSRFFNIADVSLKNFMLLLKKTYQSTILTV